MPVSIAGVPPGPVRESLYSRANAALIDSCDAVTTLTA